jgi:hypothetical protein
MSRNVGALTLLDPSGPAWPVMGVLYLYLFAYRKEKTKTNRRNSLNDISYTCLVI